MSSKNHYKLICFDFDGTIADSMPLLEENAVLMMQKYFHEETEKARQKYRLSTGLPFRQQLDVVYPNSPMRWRQKAVSEFEKMKKNSLMKAPLFPDVRNVFMGIKNGGLKIAISSSSKGREISNYLKRNQVLKYVDYVLGYRPGFEKGADHFNYLEKVGGISKTDMVYVGDSLNDMRRAYSEGVYFIGKTGIMFEKEDFAIPDEEGHITRFQTIEKLEELMKKVT